MLLLPWKLRRWHSTHIELFKRNQSAIKCRCILRKIIHNGPILMKLCQSVLAVRFLNTVYVNHSRGVSKYFFAERVVGPWNSLPTDTDFGTLKRFKLSIKSVDFKKMSTHWVLICWCCILTCAYYYYFILWDECQWYRLAFSYSLQFTTVLFWIWIWNVVDKLPMWGIRSTNGDGELVQTTFEAVDGSRLGGFFVKFVPLGNCSGGRKIPCMRLWTPRCTWTCTGGCIWCVDPLG